MTDDEIRAIWNRTQEPVALVRAVLAAAPLHAEQQEPCAWARARFIHDRDGRSIGTDYPEMVWGDERPDGDDWLPLYGEPQVASKDAAGVPPGEWGGMSPKQAWWAGYRVGKGLPADMPRSEAVAAAPGVLDDLARWRWVDCTPHQGYFERHPKGLWVKHSDLTGELDNVSDLGASLGGEIPGVPQAQPPGFVKPDNDKQVFFYEQDFYVLSNFSAFTLMWKGNLFDTSEAAYHSEKFAERDLRMRIMMAPSAHEAFKLAEGWRDRRRPDWDDVKVDIMRDILRAKAHQHEYVRRKLLATGDRELIEDSWRDDFWGWGADRNGLNMLGKLWMEVRTELRAKEHP